MIIKPRYKRQIKCIVLLSIMLLTSISAFIFPTDLFNSTAKVENNDKESKGLDIDNNPINIPSTSILGNDTWWNKDWKYRRIISVNNPYPVNFTDFAVNFTFNYSELGSQIQPDLDDIRIVENGILRNYYVKKDYPETGKATVWFDTNITGGPSGNTERDTYMYYGDPFIGPNLADQTYETMGWVKNGDFELDGDDSTLKFIPFGWEFTDDPVDYVADLKTPANGMVHLDSATPDEPFNNSVASYNAFVYKLTGTPQIGSQEGLDHGNYAYKWGPNTNNVEGGTTSSHEYVGTLDSYPFKVPKVEGGGIKIEFWRNARTYIFETNTEGGAQIDYDGYFIRLCNGTAAKYTSDVDDHENAYNTNFNNYLEAFGGKADFKGNVWKWVNMLRGQFDDSQNEKDTGPAAELTGDAFIDITQYEGKDIFLEFGSWGQENGDDQQNLKRSGFFQLDYVRFNYTLTATMEELQSKESSVTIVATDVDGRIVPNVNIFIVNNSAKGEENFIVNSSFTSNGIKTFAKVPRGKFNITANYTLANGSVVEVFNSIESGDGPYYFNGINYTVQIQLNIWTIDFEVADWDGIPLSYGYIEIRKSKGGTWLYNLTLDSKGKATFRWLNDTRYYYKIYYDNEDYESRKIPLNESYIYRSAYIQDDIKYTHHTINLNETHIGSYLINEKVYTDYSNDIGNKKIIKATITLEDMDDYLDDISIYYIDKDNSTGIGNENRIYYEQYPSPPNEVTDDVIDLDISLIDNTNLKNDKFAVYGLLLEVNGVNFSVSNGKIKVDLIETCNIYNKTNIARINIKTIYYNTLTKEFEEIGALIRVNTTSIASLINLTSNANAQPPLEDGYAYGEINEVPFWFLRGEKYYFTIDVANKSFVNFNLTYTSDPTQWIPGPGEKIKVYNFTLRFGSSLTFNIIPETGFNFTVFKTLLNSSYSTGSVYWGETIYLWVEYLYSENNGKTWKVMTEPPGTCKVLVRLQGSTTVLFNEKMLFTGSNGNYTLTFNSGKLSAGTSSKNYIFEIRGYHPTYNDPTPITEYVEVKAIPTFMDSYDYNSRAMLIDDRYTQNFGEIIKITVSYNITSSGQALIGASVIYSWSFGSGTVTPDPVYNGFYTLTLNTSKALTTGLKLIIIKASLENYTNIGITTAPLTISLYVEDRQTTLNNQTGELYIAKGIYVQDHYNFVFEYRDYLTEKKLTNIDVKSYTYWKTDSSGNPTGEGGSGTLIEDSDHKYILDFDTENLPVSRYLITINLQKDNYKTVSATIVLVVNIRTFDTNLDATNLKDDVISVVHGKSVDFEITLKDETRGNIPLQGATVEIDIGGDTYDMEEESPGVYTYTFKTDDVEAFFTSKTFSVTITIQNQYFAEDEIDLTLVVTMEEIFPGMPTFYFIMIVSSISGVLGALIGYRVIQQARIPKFVKKVRAVKKAIKSKSSIPSISITTKNKMFLKELGKEWRDLGISLRSILGIEEKKLPIIKAKGLVKLKRGEK